MLNIICKTNDKSEVRHTLLLLRKKIEITYIEFTDILKVLVKRFYHVVDELKEGQLVDVIVYVNANDEVQRGVPAIDYFVLSMLQEGTLVLCSGQTLAD